jgi:hypothetical protein
MIKHILLTICLIATTVESASAEDWMFKRSYHSHALPPELAQQYSAPPSRSAYRVPYVPAQYGMSVKGGYRYNHIWLRSGNSVDHTVLVEGWVDVQP